MAAYRRVYDSRHLQADCQENRDQLRNPTLGNRVWATFTFFRPHETERSQCHSLDSWHGDRDGHTDYAVSLDDVSSYANDSCRQ